MKSCSLVVVSLTMIASVALADTKKFDAQMQPIAVEYLKIQTALASDKTDGVSDAAKAIAALAPQLDPKTVTGEHAAHYAGLPAKIEAAAKAVAEAKDIAAARESLKKLSQPLAMWVTMSKPDGIDVVFCSMAKGSWLQASGAIKNPYYGASMLGCGEIVAGKNAGQKGGHESEEGHHSHGK